MPRTLEIERVFLEYQTFLDIAIVISESNKRYLLSNHGDFNGEAFKSNLYCSPGGGVLHSNSQGTLKLTIATIYGGVVK